MSATVLVPARRDARPVDPTRALAAVAAAGWLALGAAYALTWPAGHDHGSAWWAHAVAWVPMLAVMAPYVGWSAAFAARRSPARRRRAVVAEVLAGWTLVWAVAAVPITLVAVVLVDRLGPVVAVLAAGTAAALWHASPRRVRHTARCDRAVAPPLDPRRARVSCLRLGARLGGSCVGSCGALMLLMAVAGHALPVVAAAVALTWHERRRRAHFDPRARQSALVVLAVGLAAAGSAALGVL